MCPNFIDMVVCMSFARCQLYCILVCVGIRDDIQPCTLAQDEGIAAEICAATSVLTLYIDTPNLFNPTGDEFISSERIPTTGDFAAAQRSIRASCNCFNVQSRRDNRLTAYSKRDNYDKTPEDTKHTINVSVIHSDMSLTSIIAKRLMREENDVLKCSHKIHLLRYFCNKSQHRKQRQARRTTENTAEHKISRPPQQKGRPLTRLRQDRRGSRREHHQGSHQGHHHRQRKASA